MNTKVKSLLKTTLFMQRDDRITNTLPGALIRQAQLDIDTAKYFKQGGTVECIPRSTTGLDNYVAKAEINDKSKY